MRDPNDTVAVHIAMLELLVSQMNDLDIKPNDFFVMCKILETLRSEFELLKRAWI